jgi:hypothetical protein
MTVGPVYRYEPPLIQVEAEAGQAVAAELVRLETALAAARQERLSVGVQSREASLGLRR